MTYRHTYIKYLYSQNPTFCDGKSDLDLDPDPHWLGCLDTDMDPDLVEVKSWIRLRIRIRIETNADPKHGTQ